MSLGPINLSPILSGYVADRYDWRINFWILTTFTAVDLILVILFVPETQYERSPTYNTDTVATDPSQVNATIKPAEEGREPPRLKGNASRVTAEDSEQEKPLSCLQELKPYAGLCMEEQVWKHVTRLFACAMYPAVIWTFLLGGTYSGWVHLSFGLFVGVPGLAFFGWYASTATRDHPIS